jgi:hypothetical protein
MISKYTITSIAFIFLLLTGTSAQSQPIPTYSFETSTETYTPISGGNILGNSSNAYISFSDIEIGFEFNYGGVDYTTISVASNGYVKLGNAIDYIDDYPLTSFIGNDTIIAPLGGSVVSTPNGELSYQTSGVMPERIFTVQWANYTSGGEGSSLNFQVKLYETSNIIEFHYGDFDLDPNGFTSYFQVGLRGNFLLDEADVFQRLIDGDNTWLVSGDAAGEGYAFISPGAPDFAPSNGLLYTWLPAAPCVGTPEAGILSTEATFLCEGQTVPVVLEGTSEYAGGISFSWQTSTDEAEWTEISTQVSSIADLPFSGSSYYRFVITCGDQEDISNSIFVETLPEVTYASAPYLETFDSGWEDRCGPANVPNTDFWTSNPTSGFLAWRGEEPSVTFLPNFSGPAAIFQSINNEPSSTPDRYTGDLDLHVSLTGDLNYNVTFHYFNLFVGDTLEVMLSTDGGETFVSKGIYTALELQDASLEVWNQYTIALGEVDAAASIIRLRGISNGDFTTMALDDLEVFACEGAELSVESSVDILCAGSSAILTASGADNYLWSTGETTASITVSPDETSIYTVESINNEGCATTTEFTQLVEICAGIADWNKDNLSLIYPNPTQDRLTVELHYEGVNQIALFNLAGVQVYNETSTNKKVDLDLNSIQSGVYMLRIISEGNVTEIHKLIRL